MSFANRNRCEVHRARAGRVRKRAAPRAVVKPARRAKSRISVGHHLHSDAERVAKQLDAIEHDGGSGTVDLEQTAEV
jgi:hypothetical protein